MQSAANLALVYVSQGKFAETEPLAREAVAITTRRMPGTWERFSALTLLGASLSGQRQYEAAEPLLVEGYEGMETLKERAGFLERAHLDRTRAWIAELYPEWGKPGKAAEWRKE